MLSEEVIDRLLDRYPFTEHELRHLLEAATRGSAAGSTTSSAWSSLQGLVVAAASVTEESSGGYESQDPADNEKKEDPLNPERLQQEGGNEKVELQPTGDGSFLSGPAILSLLPELDNLYRIALRKVFVVPSSSSGGDDGDDLQRLLMELETCLEAIGTLLGRRGSGGAQQFLWDALFEAFQEGGHRSRSDEKDDDGTADRDDLMKFLYRAALVSMATSSHASWKKRLLPCIEGGEICVPEGWVQSLSSSGSSSTTRVSRSEWDKWTAGNQIYRCVSTALHAALGFRPRSPPLDFPPPEWFPDPLEAVAIASMGAFGSARVGTSHPDSLLLYDSDRDGLGFRLWQQALLGFCGPTMLIVRTTNGDCWGYRTIVPWKSHRTWYTANDDDSRINTSDMSSAETLEDSCYLFRLSPKWNQYKMVGSSSLSSSSTSSPFAPSARRRRSPYHQYLNVEACHQPQNRALKGLAVGGVAPDAPRLYVTDTLDKCRCSPVDQLFEPGPLLSDENEMYFDVDRILLFALCDPSAFDGMRSKGLRHVQQMESARIRAAKVDRTQFVEDVEQFTSLFAHRDQARGRCDFVAMDEESMGYYVRGKQPSARKVIVPRSPEDSPQKPQDDAVLEEE